MLWPKQTALQSNLRRKQVPALQHNQERKQVPGGLSGTGTSTMKYLVLAPHHKLIQRKNSGLIYLQNLLETNPCQLCPVQQKERKWRKRVKIGDILFWLDHHISIRTPMSCLSLIPPACPDITSYPHMRFWKSAIWNPTPRNQLDCPN